MDGQELAFRLRNGERVYGTLVLSPLAQWCKQVQATGVDFVFIDMEHAAQDRQTVSWMCQAYRALNLAPLVRIPEPDPYLAAMVIDGGASGIIAPYVEEVVQVQALRGAVKLRPLKGKRLQAILAGEEVPSPELQQYLAQYNAGNVLIINIESTPAIGDLEALVAVPDLDAVLVGPHDLSISLNVPEQYGHPRFEQAIQQIIQTARGHQIGAGVHYSFGMEREIVWAQQGANLIIHGSDVSLFRDTLRSDLLAMRAALGEREGQQRKGDDLVI